MKFHVLLKMLKTASLLLCFEFIGYLECKFFLMLDMLLNDNNTFAPWCFQNLGRKITVTFHVIIVPRTTCGFSN